MRVHSLRCKLVLGAACAVLAAGATIYSVLFNDSRLVAPMDFSAYVFRWQDLPMLIAIPLLAAYVLWVAGSAFWQLLRRNRRAAAAGRTRTLSPRLGFLGLGGFWTYAQAGEVFPFCFFLFFGFFGFFFEGKMSGTFMDERFRENARRAQLAAYRTGFGILLVTVAVLGRGALGGNLEYTLIALLCVLSLTLGLVIFLQEYLLYRYDHDDALPAEDDEGGGV